MTREIAQHLRQRIREFEDRKISAADLSREVFHAARELHDPDLAQLRRSLEMIGNRIRGLAEERVQGPAPEVLRVVDELEGELVNWT